MKKITKLVLACAIIALSVLISLSIFLLPSIKPVNADASAFSAVRAMKHIGMIAKTIHPIGSPEQKEARSYIVNTLEELGLEPVIQKGYVENNVEGFMGYVPYSGEAENIYTRLEGSGNTNQAVLMLAHYDSTLGGAGAADDASGSAVLLETARALLSSSPLKNDIIFLFTDGEEADLLGSKLFAKDKNLLKDISLAINFEARGNRGPSILFETSDGNSWLMKEFRKAVPEPVAYSITFDVYKMVKNVTDFTSFLDAGKAGFNLANLGGSETYHLPEDTADNLNQNFLQHQGAYALSLARHFGNISLENVKSDNNAVYFTVAKGLMVLYLEHWTVPFTIMAVLLFIAVSYVAFRKRLASFKGIVSGFLVSLLATIVAAVFGIAAQTIFSSLYFKLENVRNLTDLINLKRTIVLDGYGWIGITLILSFLILFALQRYFSKKVGGYSLFIGSSVTWLILAVVAVFYLPGTQYIFLWPLMISLLGLLVELVQVKQSVPKNLVLFILCVFSCVLIYVPVGYLLFQALMMLGAGIPIAILSLPAWLVLLSVSLYTGRDRKVTELL